MRWIEIMENLHLKSHYVVAKLFIIHVLSWFMIDLQTQSLNSLPSLPRHSRVTIHL